MSVWTLWVRGVNPKVCPGKWLVKMGEGAEPEGLPQEVGSRRLTAVAPDLVRAIGEIDAVRTVVQDIVNPKR